jgi:hypothetical protein
MFDGNSIDISLPLGEGGLGAYGASDFQRCKNCPNPNSPFEPMLCIPCANKYCSMFSMGCGQSCQGCRARVMSDISHPIHQKSHKTSGYAKVPTVPHSKCGQYHPVGTPCPIIIVSVPSDKPKQPSHPHSKCGQFHPVGTPCPATSHLVTMQSQHHVTAKVPLVPHTKCGQYHPVGTPCPIMMVTVPNDKPKQPSHPHSRCGYVHPVGTMCPVGSHFLQKPHGGIHKKGGFY